MRTCFVLFSENFLWVSTITHTLAFQPPAGHYEENELREERETDMSTTTNPTNTGIYSRPPLTQRSSEDQLTFLYIYDDDDDDDDDK
ncbi:hypothetical protein QBC46DRAFT_156451 [Diplogelasinospora grovesii]|uniref:Secreted protein n=1 Tax=Diplogelasinospora grovesii TaxID=303347 RepID=A0AAN6S8N4_9PEZI|nr:hypothetical protein QBC46DRAFT_156451 [Diplogelasinospora grovesii]